ncbi:DUF3231 family protein [Paenibacillus aceris]|uniref:DUF3231 family protein n=1 Tax=Paenibacillus aceris TaxID=869555 RepID=A0ABS4I0A3_9BACL|nr:DUF3231 family protein [Paenibacillus aceris]MBP1964348.1 hypothetical protein [Paenibacillus aceris]NHW36667.1 DUF3231 family protein [Paenibacillus aceris]
MPEKSKMSATELGSLWMTYQKKTMILRILEYFIAKSDDQSAKELMTGLYEKLHPMVIEAKTLLEQDGAATPIGFTKEDVNLDAPQLFENGFDIMFCRVLKEISMGMYVLHMTLSYREDIVMYYKRLTDLTQTYYNLFTQYLLEKHILPCPNFTNMPKSVGFVTDTSYMKGTNLFGQKRSINIVEFGLMHHSIETNVTGMQLMRGYAQCANDEDVKKHFIKGQELSKEILKDTTEILLQNNIQPPATPGGTVTNSTMAPFSEKLMMYSTYLLCGFSIGGQGFSSAFTLRNDMILRSGLFAKSVYDFTMEGVKLMMSKGLLEEPPEMDL